MESIKIFFAQHGYHTVSMQKSNIKPLQLLALEGDNLDFLGNTVDDLLSTDLLKPDMCYLPEIETDIITADIGGELTAIVDAKSGLQLANSIAQKLGLGKVGTSIKLSESDKIKIHFSNVTEDRVKKMLDLDNYIGGAAPLIDHFKSYQSKIERSELYMVTSILKCSDFTIEVIDTNNKTINTDISMTNTVILDATYDNKKAGILSMICKKDQPLIFAIKAVQLIYNKPKFFEFWKRTDARFTIQNSNNYNINVRNTNESDIEKINVNFLNLKGISKLTDTNSLDLLSRISDFNKDFNLDLLKGLSLYDCVGQFREDEGDLFFSNKNLTTIFHFLKNRRNSNIQKGDTSQYNYILTEDGRILGSDIFEQDDENTELLEIIASLQIDYQYSNQKLLFTISSVDVSKDKIDDIFILCVFKVENDNVKPESHKFRLEQMQPFLTYPLDFFNTPLINKYFNQIVYKHKVGNASHNIYNIIPNINAILQLSRLNIKKMYGENSAEEKNLVKAIKQLKQIELQHRILADKDITDNDIKNKNIKGILDYVIENTILRKEITLNYDDKGYREDLDIVVNDKAKDVFGVLFNLWINATKGSPLLKRELNSGEQLPVEIKVWHNDNQQLFISIENRCELESSFNQLEQLLDFKQKLEYAKGLSIIKSNMQYLKWSFSPEPNTKLDRENGIVRLEICVSKS